MAYLVLHPKGASRDELVEAIWPAQDPERTRPRFWQSVTEARKAIGDAWLHERERYQLDRSKVRVDLDEFDQLLTAARDDATSDATTLESALALWRGELLEGTDYLWADGEMRSLSATLLERVGRVRLAIATLVAPSKRQSRQSHSTNYTSRVGAWRSKPNTLSDYASRSPPLRRPDPLPR
ncbi:MAG: BTAD domain-containing putative transcriptional regulator [Solirubrobacteraceae bacterium]